jgi:hypothetical protein
MCKQCEYTKRDPQIQRDKILRRDENLTILISSKQLSYLNDISRGRERKERKKIIKIYDKSSPLFDLVRFSFLLLLVGQL